ncbi:ATP-binding protein [Streptomyces sp. S.PB5]|uniref:sensor histidine kinase n=1 Tax=Streptomyces sp. S.PB5 TaxID=3020844 RepID=UPI0025B0C4A4|nr:ATP-binding protein [Streptomyces sp. S.PB5]MDN3021589.1 ATP-binding protein [Streptomyces sp. S.PB5]
MNHLRWIALGGAAWRTLSLAIMIVAAGKLLSEQPQLLAAVGALIAGNSILLFLVVRRRAASLLKSTAFCAADLGLAVTATFWASAVIPEHTVYLQNHDLFNPYLWGTTMLWTGLQGIRTGLVILVGAALPVQLGMAWLNGYDITSPGWADIVARDLWLLTSFVVSAIIAALSWEAAYSSAAAAFRAGRVEQLKSLHDSVLQTLELIGKKATAAELPPEERLSTIRVDAERQADDIRTVLAAIDGHHGSALDRELRDLVVEFHPRRLIVELIADELPAEPGPMATLAIAGAVREALANVVKHARVGHAVVRLTVRSGAVRVTVRDQGVGYDVERQSAGFGIRNSVIGRMEHVGGTAAIESCPGEGTKVTLWVPLRSQS